MTAPAVPVTYPAPVSARDAVGGAMPLKDAPDRQPSPAVVAAVVGLSLVGAVVAVIVAIGLAQ